MNGSRVSYLTMDRMLAEEMARDPKLKRRVEKSKRPLLGHGRGMTDDELLEKLRAMGVTVDRERIDRETRSFLKAQDLASAWIEEFSPRGEWDKDWVWICVTVLWERWFPDRPNQEQLDERIHAGYVGQQDGVCQACEIWLTAWRDLLALAERAGTKTVEEFDERFALTQCAFNWLQDLEMDLLNAGVEDARFVRRRIDFCNELLERFGSGDPYFTGNMRRAIAESHFRLDLVEEAEAMLRKWLAADPQWGWGWIELSDGFGTFASERARDWEKAISILKEGLSVDGVRDRKDILERLETTCSEAGKTEEAASARRQIEDLHRPDVAARGVAGTARVPSRKIIDPDLSDSAPAASMSQDPSRLVSEKKAGRNDPCPCGSGRKYKKCCGR